MARIRSAASRLVLAASLALALTGLTASSAAATGAAQSGAAADRPLPLIVRTADGLVQGKFAGGAREFLGIPYAAPPIGAQRWRPPQPAIPWQGVRDATTPGANCAQTGSIATGVPVTSTAEDCLFLNVYTPPDGNGDTTGGRPLPVMVWIHGGGFTGGAGSIYDGALLAATQHVIVVTINYRLNAFGFLALPSLDTEAIDHSSGDYGLMDQQAAMRWVRRNAAAFGGNPFNVTIFGESAGGASVCANMASPTAFGLFDKAIAESGCLFPAASRPSAEQQGTALASTLGCTDPSTAADCLRAKPVADILKAENGLGFGPVVGGATLPEEPAQAFADGRYLHVPLINGTNHDEGRFFVGLEFDALGHPITAAQYPVIIGARFGANAAAVLAHYPLSAYPSPDLAFAAVFTDSSFSCPALAADKLAQGSGVYAYEFADPNPPNDFGITFTFPFGAAHSTELQYVFGKIPFLDVTPPFTAAQQDLSAQMMHYWATFAATGTPNGNPLGLGAAPTLSGARATAAGDPGGMAPHWPRFTAGQPQVQELVPAATAPQSAASFAAFHQCAFWSTITPGP